MKSTAIEQIHQLNPWLREPNTNILKLSNFLPRKQEVTLKLPEWDTLWTVLTGPRRSGKTTLGFHLSEIFLKDYRYKQLLYLNCDYLSVRNWLNEGASFINEAIKQFNLQHDFILFIDEAQRISNPGLLLKSIVDLKLPIKLIATGSSQLEIKSRIQEHLTGRQLEAIVLPFSYTELLPNYSINHRLIFGCYPQIFQTNSKEILLQQLYKDYISKDIVEILKLGKPEVIEKLIFLLAHSSGQLVNYTQLSADCKVSNATVQNYLDILEQTYVIKKITPFVGNKRAEITSNPIYYFIDNGFRNQALNNFADINSRTDNGLLVESAVFQEIYKFKTQYFKNFNINFWRTKSGAEIDFILYKNKENIIPIEVKFKNFSKSSISRAFRSFIQAYRPKTGIYITKNWIDQITVDECKIYFIPLSKLDEFIILLKKLL